VSRADDGKDLSVSSAKEVRILISDYRLPRPLPEIFERLEALRG
jgi:hypothetical protein